MKIILINIIILSFIMGTRVIDSSNILTLGDNRSCGQRPILDNNIISPSGSFMIHYDNYYDGIDDYAYSVAIAADSSRKVIVEIMNFRSEVQDDDGLYDIYIEQLPNGSYGWNCPDGDLGKSWVEIDDDYIGTGYSTSGLDAMKISVAHEYFHAIQRSYKPIPGQNSFFYELSSIWIEDIVYPEINDYIFFSQYGDDYFLDPEKNMNDYNGYGLGLYGHYMNFEFDNQIMQRIWEDFSLMDSDDETEYVFNAIDNVLNNQDFGYNSSFAQTWLDFNSKNIFNGYFEDMNNNVYYYFDQNQFNPIQTNIYNINQYLEPIDDYPDSYTEYFEYSINANDKSIKIRSFDVNNDNQEFLFFIDGNGSHSSLGLFSDSQTGIYNLDFSNNYILNENNIFHFLYTSDYDNNNIITTMYKRTIGCTDSNACNYNGEATYDDDSCEYITCSGCVDPNACNYNENTIIENNDDCEYPFICWDNSTSCDLLDCPSGYDIKIGPNPFKSGQNLNIILHGSILVDNFKFQIIDINGKLINSISLGSIEYNQDDFNIISFNPFNNMDLSNGLYILKLDLDGKVINKKITYLK